MTGRKGGLSLGNVILFFSSIFILLMINVTCHLYVIILMINIPNW